MIDAHLHLQDRAYDPDRDDVLRRAEAAGVRLLVCNGRRPADWPAVLELSRSHPGVVPCFGLHPWYAGEAPAGWLETLEGFLDSVPSGVGEAGLDGAALGRAAQEEALRRQLALARSRNRPLMLHCVRAFGRLLELLSAEGPPRAGFLLHAYRGPAGLVERFVRLNAYLSFSASCLDESRPRSVQALRAVPADRLLLETDCPGSKSRGEPSDVRSVLRLAARLRGESEDRLEAAIWENAGGLLGPLIRL